MIKLRSLDSVKLKLSEEMTPAPGPITSVESSSNLAEATGSNVVGNENTNRLAQDSEESGSRATGSHPKTCSRCGRHIEANDISGADVVASAASAPSPSSIAFVSSNTASTSSVPSNSIAAMLSSSPAMQDTMQIDSEGNQICSSCLNLMAEEHDASSSAQPRTTLSLESDIPSTQLTDTVMQSADQSTSLQHSAGATPLPSANTNRHIHPWRRSSPWAQSRQSESNNLVPEEDERSNLTISVGNMGAGGDAVRYAADDVDFPPLARSASSESQSGAAVTSPRLPISPGRGRSATSNSTERTASPSGRPSSFSRSSQPPLANGSTGSSEMTTPTAHYTTSTRHRAASSGNAINAPSLSRGRRPSVTRRLSRSNSSQGPTSSSFAGLGEIVSGTAIAENEDQNEAYDVGPSKLTRPRLSLLSTQEIVSLVGSPPNTPRLPDVFTKPFSSYENSKSYTEKDVNNVLTWYNCNRPDPLRDVSILHCTSIGRGCLFPGSTFRGTQRSGRMSYDVTVQIANVDLASSHLCGYLNIRGLTDDWPELTTYFDAEIIGQRHGFVTGKWGASEADDLKHWSRFTPFRPIKNTLTKPGLRFNHLNKPFIFMRWKERFLVPDHRVRDINGASFAGKFFLLGVWTRLML